MVPFPSKESPTPGRVWLCANAAMPVTARQSRVKLLILLLITAVVPTMEVKRSGSRWKFYGGGSRYPTLLELEL